MHTEAVVAIKIIGREDRESDNQIKKEIEIMKKIDHDNIIKLIDYEEERNSFFVVSEFIDGCELFDIIVNKFQGHTLI